MDVREGHILLEPNDLHAIPDEGRQDFLDTWAPGFKFEGSPAELEEALDMHILDSRKVRERAELIAAGLDDAAIEVYYLEHCDDRGKFRAKPKRRAGVLASLKIQADARKAAHARTLKEEARWHVTA